MPYMNAYPYQIQTITIAGENFQGPFTTISSLRNIQGVYAILDKRVDGKWYPIDAGEAAEGVYDRINTHDRKDCWERHRRGTLGVAVYYTPNWTDQQRRSLEYSVRKALNPPCGQR